MHCNMCKDHSLLSIQDSDRWPEYAGLPHVPQPAFPSHFPVERPCNDLLLLFL